MEEFATIITFTSSVCMGLAVTCAALLLFDILEFVHVDKEKARNEDAKRLPALIRLFLPWTSMVSPLLKDALFDHAKRSTDELLNMAGYDQTISAKDFVAVKVIAAGVGFVLMILLFMAGQPMGGLLILLVLPIYPGAWLKSTVRKRHLEILKALPNVLDLLTLSVEAGRDFLTALRDILARRKKDALGEELQRTLHEIQLGKQRQVALKELSLRVRQTELTSVINAIIQAEELGVSIGQLLRIQGDQLRSKRFARAEKLANEAPVKILFPVVIFIFPSVILMLLAPIILQAFKTLLK